MNHRRRSLGRIRRRLLVGLLLVGYVVGTIGFPIPRLSAGHATADPCVLKQCGCPVTGAPDACCCVKPVRSTCCETTPPAPPPAPTLVLGFSARQCHGKNSDELSTITAVQPPPLVRWACSQQPEGWLVPVSLSSAPLPTTPPAPPPRPVAL